MYKNESKLEKNCLKWFASVGWEVANGEDIATDGKLPLRKSMTETVLRQHAMEALVKINPDIPKAKLQEALNHAIKPDSRDLAIANHNFAEKFLYGVPIKYNEGGKEKHVPVKFIDFANIDNNRFMVVNQFTVTGDDAKAHTRRPDIVCFINGFPIAVIELKILAEDPKMIEAYNQLQTYKTDIPALFVYNQILATSDGLNCHIGSLTSSIERFSPWRSEGKEKVEWQLEAAVQKLFPPKDILYYMRYFISFEKKVGKINKKCAAYHQFYGVRSAIKKTLSAVKGDKQAGVFWHTQGSGKSYSMCCYAAILHRHSQMKNPTIVVVTDRSDLDGQLLGNFHDAKFILRQTPKQAKNISDLRKTLGQTGGGGIIFTTMQKFELTDKDKEKGITKFPELNDRDNIIVIADEAHRTQYGLRTKLKDGHYKAGFARNLREALPNATFIGFTGTPIALDDRDTQAVFGDYVSVYDVKAAIKDKVTVKILYEARLAKLKINDEEITQLTQKVEDVLENEELEAREKTKQKWTSLEKLVGAKPRIKKIAKDIVKHYEKRNSDIRGKAMIVAMSRKTCVSLYDEIVTIKPDWHDPDPYKGQIKIIMTGSASDGKELQPHITNKRDKVDIETRFKDPDDPLNIVIVRDMWLTGFDVPPCHTMYIDKPMKGHNLMQAIARVNRVFKDKEGGLIVDYIGIAADLKKAVKTYTDAKGKGKLTEDLGNIYRELIKRLEQIRGLFAKTGKAKGFNYSGFENEKKAQKLLPEAANYLLSEQVKDGKKRFLDIATAMRKAYAHCQTMDEVTQYEEEIAFFFAIRQVLVNYTAVSERLTQAEKDTILQHVLNSAVISEGIQDILGMPEQDISVLSDEFLDKMQESPHKSLVAELLEKLIKDTIKSKSRTNIVQAKDYEERLKKALNRYYNRSIEAAEVIQELIAIAKDYRKDLEREQQWDMNPDEIAFYDALVDNESAVREMEDEILRKIATEIADKLRQDGTLDWAQKESVRAGLRIRVRRILKKYKYPPDATPNATETVIRQAEAIEIHKAETL